MNIACVIEDTLTALYLSLGRELGYPAPIGRILLTMQVSDTQDVLITATGGLDAKGAPAALGSALTAAVDDTVHFSVAPEAGTPNVFRVTRLPDAAGDAAGVLTPKVTVTDTAAGVSGVFTFESDPSAETAITLTGAPAPAATDGQAAQASDTQSAQAAPPNQVVQAGA